MARWVRLVLLVAAVQVPAGAYEDHGGPHAEHRWNYYCGYGKEDHSITTKKGYKLTAFRLRSNVTGEARREPILLQHGIATNGNAWFQLRHNSLPCVLARIGYDVWVANSRGTKFSRGHTKHSLYSHAYWYFTIHELAVDDLPATIDYILGKTGKRKLSYVGDDVGGTLIFILLSEPKFSAYNAKVTVAVTFAPVCYVYPAPHVGFAALTVFALKDVIEVTFEVGLVLADVIDKYVPKGRSVNSTLKKMGDDDKFYLEILKTFDYAMNERQYRGASYVWDITSIRVCIHYCQLLAWGSFGMYFYGPFENWVHYSSPFPTRYRYQLKNIRTPQFIICSYDDNVVKPSGVYELIGYLAKNVGEMHWVRKKKFGHTDFLYSGHAKQYVYDVAVRELKRYLPPPPPPPPPPPTTTTPVNPECLISK